MRGSITVGLALAAMTMLLPVDLLEAQDVGLPVGSDAPAVQLEDLEGQTVDLADLIGERPLLIEFWAIWCGQCAKLAPKIEAAHEQYGDRVEFVIVAIAVNQSVRRVARHFADEDHGFRVLWDGDGAAVRAYKVPTTAVVMVVDAAGRISYTGAGPDQDLETALAEVTETEQ